MRVKNTNWSRLNLIIWCVYMASTFSRNGVTPNVQSRINEMFFLISEGYRIFALQCAILILHTLSDTLQRIETRQKIDRIPVLAYVLRLTWVKISTKTASSIRHDITKEYSLYTKWFKYDRDWFVCKQAALRSSCVTLREWNHNLHPPSCSS